MVDGQEPADLRRAPLQLEFVLDEVVQPHVRGELRSLVPLSAPGGVLVSGPSVVGPPVAAAAELPADRRRATPQPATDLPDPETLGGQGLDPLALEEREVAPRDRDATSQVTAKAPVLPPPPQPGASADTDLTACLHGAQPRGQQVPVEPFLLQVPLASPTSHRDTLHEVSVATTTRTQPHPRADPVDRGVQRQRPVLGHRLTDQPHRPLTQLVGILPRCWHDPTLPWNQTLHETRGASLSGTCYPTPRPASTTSAPTSTTTASVPNGPNATTSVTSKPSATGLPSSPPPDLTRARLVTP